VRQLLAVSACTIAATAGVVAIAHPRAGDAQSPAPLGAPARFDSLPAGWHRYDSGVVRLGRRGGVSETGATSWDFDRSNRHGPAGDLPPRGILVWVLLLRHSCGAVAANPAYPPLRTPLRLPRAPTGTLEGRPHVPEYRILGARGRDYYVEARVDINERSPSAKLRRRAQRALSALRLPDWPASCR
jgi:hypothetical protein